MQFIEIPFVLELLVLLINNNLLTPGGQLVCHDWLRPGLPSELEAQEQVQRDAAGVQRERRPGATEQVLAARGLQAKHAGEESQRAPLYRPVPLRISSAHTR